jgi:diaminohydroxyphosphoribosylaminopyrimidine deaminase/5-amino-6-(5-phosphoribosylamino)uracil reductase
LIGQEETDLRMMRRALELAMRGRGSVEPNPMVGCVIVKSGSIIGEGYHEKVGGPHAEPNALAACIEDPAGATAFVNLEPCCHLTKRTPPCVPRLIAAKIARVVVGCRDPNPLVSGQGITQLRDAGIEVTENILGNESRQLNAAFFKHIEQRRPYVTLKWAETADGKVASSGGNRLIISNDQSHLIVHKLRAISDAIMVGVNTVLADDPLLTARVVAAGRQPMRITLDTHLRTPMTSRLVITADQSPVLIYCSESAYKKSPEIARAPGVEIQPIPLDAHGHISLTHMLNDLGGRSVTHLLVEPGPKLAAAFLRENLADRVRIFRSQKVLNDPHAPAAAKVDYPSVAEDTIAGDRITEYLNTAGTAYFAPMPSADYQIAVLGSKTPE